MKLSLVIFTIAAFCAPLVLGLGESFEGAYNVSPGRRCEANRPECCRQASKCSLVYTSRGLWTTIQDRVATDTACKAVCGIHFKKCETQCTCVARQHEVQSSKICKCTNTVPRTFVRNSCLRFCIDARKRCEINCHTKKCPLKAVTRMAWKQEFTGRCQPICELQHPLTNVCPILSSGQ